MSNDATNRVVENTLDALDSLLSPALKRAFIAGVGVGSSVVRAMGEDSTVEEMRFISEGIAKQIDATQAGLRKYTATDEAIALAKLREAS
jgi:hypothetical protein